MKNLILEAKRFEEDAKKLSELREIRERMDKSKKIINVMRDNKHENLYLSSNSEQISIPVTEEEKEAFLSSAEEICDKAIHSIDTRIEKILYER